MDETLGSTFNEQVVPSQVWERLLHEYRQAHTSPMHRAWFAEMFAAYLHGVADGMEVDPDELLRRVSEVAR